MNRHWRRVWLIGLLIVLLPLRGWAWAAMPVAVPVAPAHEVVLPPCHAAQSGSESEFGGESERGKATATGHATCNLCDLCHASVITPPDARWQHAQVPACTPSWAVSPVLGREGGDDLFRPPRG